MQITEDIASSSQGLPYHEQALLRYCIDQKLIYTDQLQVVLTERRHKGDSIDRILISLGWVLEDEIIHFWSHFWGIACVDLSKATFEPEAIHLLPKHVCQELGAIPLCYRGHHLIVAVSQAHDISQLDTMRRYFPPDIEVVPVLAPLTKILEAIDKFHANNPDFGRLFEALEKLSPDQATAATPGPVIRAIETFLMDAAHRRASDIHFEPTKIVVYVRYRLDSMLYQIWSFHKSHWARLCVRLKLMAGMDIGEARRPQDGRFTFSFCGRDVDCRVATHPTMQGEKIAIRLLDKRRALKPLEQLGYSSVVMQGLRQSVSQPDGMIIFTGPTGCGKTTSLYALLMVSNTTYVNTMTLEEPVEYSMSQFRQTDLTEGAKLSFAQGLRSLLRQDPDKILLGEIRDEETAKMALRASMTGHQVFTTLHTQDAVSALGRLLELGVSPVLLRGNIRCVVAQRLVRQLCVYCKQQSVILDTDALMYRVQKGTTIYEEKGCEHCYHTGYAGQFAIAELLQGGEQVDTWLANPGGTTVKNFRNLAEDAIFHILQGNTSIKEIKRVLGDKF